jgi:hypothetical protein
VPRSKPQAATPPRPALDRFGTHRLFVRDKLAGLTAGRNGSLAAAVVWFVLWDLANGRTGLVRGASVTRLARLGGMDRKTVQKAIRRLLKDGAIAVHSPGLVPVYVLVHVEPDEPGVEWKVVH